MREPLLYIRLRINCAKVVNTSIRTRNVPIGAYGNKKREIDRQTEGYILNE